ncbi:MAG: hypothetical protein EOM54_13290 [Clostridia bacterium]|nr:hypothetical protein [Clostridia bacterium]
MKYVKKQLVFFICYLIAGALLVAAALLWSPAVGREGIITGIVGGFLVTGIGGIVICARLLKNPQKAEAAEMAKTEERTQFLRLKIQSAVHSATIMLVCLGTITALIIGRRDITLTLAALLIADFLLYVGFGTYYAKKY